ASIHRRPPVATVVVPADGRGEVSTRSLASLALVCCVKVVTGPGLATIAERFAGSFQSVGATRNVLTVSAMIGTAAARGARSLAGFPARRGAASPSAPS